MKMKNALALATPDRDQKFRDALLQRLRNAKIDDWQGKVLYSSVNTLKKGPVYLLMGYNPGGDPTKEPLTLAEHITQSPEDCNEYLDAAWMPGGRRYAPGQAPLQKRVRWLLAQLGLQPREVCAINLVFKRSISLTDLGSKRDRQRLADLCWPIHDWILGIVQPRVIICIGTEAFNYIRERGQLRSVSEFPSGHGDWMCCETTVRLGNITCQLVSLPHLARYAVTSHPEVPEWIRGMTAGPLPLASENF
jgi:hypothetical protein